MTGDDAGCPVVEGLPLAWLNSAALARAGGDLEVEGGVVERDGSGEPTGILREESAWRFRARFAMPSEDEFVDATRAGLRLAASRGVVAIHDKDGWLGAPGIFQRLAERDGAHAARLAVASRTSALAELEALGVRSGIGDDFLRIGYLKAFMDGTLGSQTAWMLDGSGVVITSGEELAEIIRAGRADRLAGRRARDRRPREPRGARRVRGDAGRRGRRSASASASSTPSASPPRTCRASPRSASPARSSSAMRPRTATSPSGSGASGRRARTASARCWESGALVANGSDAPVEELDPLAGIRAGVLRTIDERPAWHPEEAVTVEQALTATIVNPAWLSGDERRRGKLLPGYLADLVVLSRDPLECSPDELESVEVVATMVGGRWTHNPPPWD